jgi:hypothetical protein
MENMSEYRRRPCKRSSRAPQHPQVATTVTARRFRPHTTGFLQRGHLYPLIITFTDIPAFDANNIEFTGHSRAGPSSTRLPQLPPRLLPLRTYSYCLIDDRRVLDNSFNQARRRHLGAFGTSQWLG